MSFVKKYNWSSNNSLILNFSNMDLPGLYFFQGIHFQKHSASAMSDFVFSVGWKLFTKTPIQMNITVPKSIKFNGKFWTRFGYGLH